MWVTKKFLTILIGIIVIAVIVTTSGFAIMVISQNLSKGVIVIDAGHGGTDGGAAHGDLVESTITLDIALRFQTKLQEAGYKVIMTRLDNNALDTTKEKDMKKRAEIIKNAKPDMVISLHVNKFSSSYRRGVQVFYDDSNNNKAIATMMQSVLNTDINNKYCGRNDFTSLGGDYFIAKCTKFPTVIVETGFISNESDRALLKSDEYKNNLVISMVKAINNMQNTTHP